MVGYAVSFADTPEEAVRYADLVISSLETVVTVAGAIGGYKAGKAISDKLANLRANYTSANVKKTFEGKVAKKTDLQTTMKVEVGAVTGKTAVVTAETAVASQAANDAFRKNVQRNVLERGAGDADSLLETSEKIIKSMHLLSK